MGAIVMGEVCSGVAAAATIAAVGTTVAGVSMCLSRVGHSPAPCDTEARFGNALVTFGTVLVRNLYATCSCALTVRGGGGDGGGLYCPHKPLSPYIYIHIG